jgi:hypothetical protein
MRRAISYLALLGLAACLSEPGRPGGGGDDTGPTPSTTNRLHHHVAVGDINGDGVEDLLLWGHDDSAGDGKPTLFVYYGGSDLFTTPAQTIDLTIAAPIADTDNMPVKWYEPLDAYISDRTPPDVIVATAQDTSLPVPVPFERWHYMTRLTYGSGGLSIAAHTGSPPQRMMGGYVDSDEPVFARVRVNAGAEEILWGDDLSIFTETADFPLNDRAGELAGSNLDPYLTSRVLPVEQGMFVLPGTGAQQDLLDVAANYAFRTSGSDGPLNGLTLTDDQPIRDADHHLVRGRLDAHTGVTATVATDVGDQYFTITTIGSDAPSVSYLLATGTATGSNGRSKNATDLAIGNLAGSAGELDVVTIDGGALRAYLGLTFAGSDASARTTVETDALGSAYDLLALGAFQPGAGLEIYVIDRTHLNAAKLCFELNATADGLQSCAVGSGS